MNLLLLLHEKRRSNRPLEKVEKQLKRGADASESLEIAAKRLKTPLEEMAFYLGTIASRRMFADELTAADSNDGSGGGGLSTPSGHGRVGSWWNR